MSQHPSDAPSPDAIFLRLSRQIPDTGDASALVDSFLTELMRSLGVRAWLALWDASAQRAQWYPPGEEEPFPARLVEIDGSLLARVLRHGEARIVTNLDEETAPEKSYLERSGGCWALLPLQALGETVAGLVVRGSGARAVSNEALSALKETLPLAALILRMKSLRQEADDRVEERTLEISLLYDLSRSLGFVLGTRELFDLVARSLHKALGVDMCGFLTLAPEEPGLELHLFCEAAEDSCRKMKDLVSAEAGRVAGPTVEAIPMTVVGGRVPGERRKLSPDDLRSVAHSPLYIRGDVVGILSLGSRRTGAFGPAQFRLLSTIANQTSLTLDRLRLAHEAETRKIHSMLESMAEGVLLVDRDLQIVMSNPAAQSYLSTLRGDEAQRTLESLGGFDVGSLMESLGEPGAKTRSFEVEGGAEPRLFSVTCSPVRGLGAEVQAMVVVISDVTEARQLQAQLAQNEKLSALGELISGVAHELNNPLASVMGNAQLLQATDVGADIRRKLTAIDTEAARCRKIVQNLLRFAHHQEPERAPVDLAAAIDSVLQLLGHQLEVEGIQVDVDLSGAATPVMGDSHLLQQVFLNIVFNAFQAMEGQPRRSRLSISSRTLEGEVIIEITDSGPGISPGHINRIFDPFFSTKEVGRGTGLGLSLAYTTVTEHGGLIQVTSRQGEGTTFVVRLPAATAADIAAAGPMDEPRAVAPRADAAQEAPARRCRILVVEDEPELAEVLAEALQSLGHEVETVGDGLKARDRVSSAKYDLIISDLKMPNMNGRDFYRHVAEVEPALARRIIFSTGDTANPDTRAFFKEVGNRFLTKPFLLSDLAEVVDSVLADG